MSLDRQDVRAKLDADVHEALIGICAAKGVTVAEFIENVLVLEILRVVHESHDISEKTPRLRIAGKIRDPNIKVIAR